MSKIKNGSTILLVSHGPRPQPNYPPLGATGTVTDEKPDDIGRYRITFAKEEHGRWKVKRACFIVIDDGNLDKITEEEDNPYFTEKPKQRETTE